MSLLCCSSSLAGFRVPSAPPRNTASNTQQAAISPATEDNHHANYKEPTGITWSARQDCFGWHQSCSFFIWSPSCSVSLQLFCGVLSVCAVCFKGFAAEILWI